MKKERKCSHQPEVVQYRRHSAKDMLGRGLPAGSKKKRASLSSVAALVQSTSGGVQSCPLDYSLYSMYVKNSV